MFEYIHGIIRAKSPTKLVLDVQGVGYAIEIPLSTAEKLPSTGNDAQVWTYLQVGELIQKLFGFATEEERSLFLMLIKVSGVGPSTAIAILSRASVPDIARAICEGQVVFLKSLKGVGPKTAQRLVTELRDQVEHLVGGKLQPATGIPGEMANSTSEDAIQALEVLGCPPKPAHKAVAEILKTDPDMALESVVRAALTRIWPASTS